MPLLDTTKNQYQRLEFLGDRVLNLVVSDIIFNRYPVLAEGELTKTMGFTSNDNLEGILDKLDKSVISALLTFKQFFGLDATALSADKVWDTVQRQELLFL